MEQHRSFLSNLIRASDTERVYRESVKQISDKLAAEALLAVLRQIPVEEFNRQKCGIRTKLLREHCYCTLADVYAASVYQLASIRGIGENSAYTVKRMAFDFAEQAKKEVKIKLNADDRTPIATELVRAVSILRGSAEPIDTCRQLLSANRERIEEAMEALRPATKDLTWLFRSKRIKNQATEAYRTLRELLEEPYFLQGNQAVSALEQNEGLSEQAAWQDFQNNSARFFTLLEEINPGLFGNSDAVYGLPEELARQVREECFFPNGLRCSLRRYQEWGVKYILHQEKVLLGDEMGLGKTVQAIATMVSLKNTGGTHFVVLCPAGVLTNWCREIEKHSLLAVTKVYGSSRTSALQSWIRSGGVAVTTYETVSAFEMDESFRFSLMVVDEAHYIKNPKAQRTVNAVKLSRHADRLLFMTGTALENHADEMLGLIRILQPNLADQAKGLAFLSSASQFRQKIAPVYYRRKREDVLTELPELIESREWCSLQKEEEERYEQAVLGRRYADARRVSWNVEDLKQSSKAQRLLEIVNQAEEEGRKVLVFSYFLDTVRKISLFLGHRCMSPINGSVTPQRRQEIIDEFDKAPAGSVLPA